VPSENFQSGIGSPGCNHFAFDAVYDGDLPGVWDIHENTLPLLL
jgi:hypothetical protein